MHRGSSLLAKSEKSGSLQPNPYKHRILIRSSSLQNSSCCCSYCHCRPCFFTTNEGSYANTKPTRTKSMVQYSTWRIFLVMTAVVPFSCFAAVAFRSERAKSTNRICFMISEREYPCRSRIKYRSKDPNLKKSIGQEEDRTFSFRDDCRVSARTKLSDIHSQSIVSGAP